MSDVNQHPSFVSRLPSPSVLLPSLLAIALIMAIALLGFALSRQIQINAVMSESNRLLETPPFDLNQMSQQLITAFSGVSILLLLFGAVVAVNMAHRHPGHSRAETAPRPPHDGREQSSRRLEPNAARAPVEAHPDEERHLLRTLIDTIPTGIYVKDVEGRFTLTNLTHARFMGTTLEDIKGKRDHDFMPAELAQRYYADEQAVMRTGQPLTNHEEPVKDQQGNLKWASTTKVPLRDSQGSIVGLVGISYDITERKQIEEERAHERNLLRTVVDLLPDALFAHDLEGRIVLDNVANRRFVGLSEPDETLGKTVYDYYSPERARKFDAQNQAIIQTGEPLLNDEQVNPDAQGNLHSVLVTKVPLRDSQGNIVGIVGIARDISERKQMEEALAKERALLETVIDNLPDPIFVKDREGRNILVNLADMRFAGAKSPSELLGKTVFDFFPPARAAEYHAVEQNIMRTGDAQYNHEEEHTDGQGNHRYFITSKVPLRDGQGNITGLVGIVRDITERKQMEEALARERNLLRTVMNSLPDFVYVKDTDSRFIVVNETCLHDRGLKNAEELIGKNDFDIQPPDLAALYYADDQEVMRSGVPLINRDESNVSATGEKRHFSTTKVPLRDGQGNVIGLVGVSHDVTLRRQMEETFASERNLLRTVIDTLPDLIYVRNLEGRMLLVNQACLRFVGATSDDAMIGKTDFDFYEADKATRYFAEEQAMMRSGEPIVNQEEFVVEAHTGNSMWVSATKVPLRDAEGTTIGMVGVSRDITARKQAEQALAEERNLLRTVIDNIPDYIYVKDRESKFLLRNVAGIQLLGVQSADEVIGKTDFDLFPEELARDFYEEEQTIIQTGHAIVNQEALVTERSGVQHWLLYTKVPFRDSHGNIIGIVGVSRDIDERKQAEAQLRKLSSAVEQSSSAIIITDIEGAIEYLNPQFSRLTGYTAEEALGQKPSLWQSGKVAPEVYQNLWSRILDGGEWRGELLNRRNNGDLFWCLTTISSIRNQEGEVTHFIAVQEDITERKHAEEALKRTHDQLEYERAQLQAILDSMGEGVIYDEQLQTRYINQALTRLTGYTVEEWQGYLHPLRSEQIIESEFEAMSRAIYDAVGRKGIWRGEIRLRRKDGSEFDAGLTCTEVTGADDQVVGAVTIIRDISVEKALQEQKSRFVANASHELRTPITNLKTRLYLMHKQPEKMDYHLQVVEEVAARMQRLVEDMLDVSRFERGLIPLHQREVNLQELVAGVVEVQRAEADLKQIRLDCELSPEPMIVLADPERITQVITNLLVNAINYTPEGGQISVDVESSGEFAAIHVRDTGLGIAPDLLQQVFQPFFRASQGLSDGTGLGLTIVKDIVELHGGSIEIDSQVGEGSCFSVKLALHKTSAQPVI